LKLQIENLKSQMPKGGDYIEGREACSRKKTKIGNAVHHDAAY
jgi:hypothetical protein